MTTRVQPKLTKPCETSDHLARSGDAVGLLTGRERPLGKKHTTNDPPAAAQARSARRHPVAKCRSGRPRRRPGRSLSPRAPYPLDRHASTGKYRTVRGPTYITRSGPKGWFHYLERALLEDLAAGPRTPAEHARKSRHARFAAIVRTTGALQIRAQVRQHAPTGPSMLTAAGRAQLGATHTHDQETCAAHRRPTYNAEQRPGGPRSIWAPRRAREVGAQFPDRQGRVSPSQALSKPQCPKQFGSARLSAAPPRVNVSASQGAVG